MAPLSEYERQREENIRKNKELLRSLGLDGPLSSMLEPKEAARKKESKSRKRKAEQAEAPEEPPAKARRADSEKLKDGESAPVEGVRRSSRNTGKVVDYKNEIKSAHSLPYAYSSGVKTTENEGPLGREGGKRVHDPKKYGSIPGVDVGTWWETREGCSTDAIHAPWVGGISGGKDGAYSVALSGGYDDDVDLGYAFTYTGSGGRDLKGTKNNPKNLRTAPQSSDQSFDNNFNRMLLRSSQTKKPVRVIRGYKLRSRYAPSEGYRYDGLYAVERAWMEKGLNDKGYLVCKYAFKRLPNQPLIPVRGEVEANEAADEDANENEESQSDEASNSLVAESL
ncbi:hypothetical protein FA15DRAFT_9868 [Coprinopsis marcescibilis]|uniref:YDG domain-containing protein n=1 Tax=Coprinopsis marcescibilis TaxID=230819 RepID=A0A5C3LP22_COPMA|nr:hypothetical protein FA15DRAFT_9868 [Coprinopsis marcescibilis]